MRKKLKMRAGGKVAKYAEGGRVGGPRPTEDRARMAADAAAGFDAEEENMRARRAARMQPTIEREAANARAREAWRNGQSAITNRPVGAAPSRVAARPDDRMDGPAVGSMQNRDNLPMPPPEPTTPPPMRARATRRPMPRRSARQEMSADDLNARELNRLGVTPLRKGGRVVGKKK